MNWKIEAFVQRTLAALPMGRQLYYGGQRLAGNLRNVGHFTIGQKVDQALYLLDGLLQSGRDIENSRTVELGTGVSPVIPLLLWLFGQGECHTFDVIPLLRDGLINQSCRQLLAWCARPEIPPSTLFPRLVLTRPEAVLARLNGERLRQLAEMVARGMPGRELLAHCQIAYYAPSDTGRINLPDASIDLVYSNAVFEHVPGPALEGIVAECYRLLRPGRETIHQIDLSDHFSHSDPSLSALHFLQFSEAQFAHYNNPILYQNRLRAPAYRQLFTAGGFEICQWHPQHSPKAHPLPTIHPHFAAVPAGEITITALRLIARKQP